ncbi:MAG: hypothetical protein V4555_15125 [Acidobacteriota bacterium]
MIEIPLTEEQYADGVRRLQEKGIAIAGAAGTLSRDGVTARYSYGDGKLTIEVVDRPFFLPVSLIEQQMRGYIEKAMAGDSGHSGA